jgi:hypothetical protein
VTDRASAKNMVKQEKDERKNFSRVHLLNTPGRAQKDEECRGSILKISFNCACREEI